MNCEPAVDAVAQVHVTDAPQPLTGTYRLGLCPNHPRAARVWHGMLVTYLCLVELAKRWSMGMLSSNVFRSQVAEAIRTSGSELKPVR
jgi:hypothetical protein